MNEEDLPRIFSYICGIINGLGGRSIEVGGMPDHIHILTSLPKTMTLADFARAIKADSSKWMKQLDTRYESKHTFQEEYKLFLDSYGIEYDEKYAFCD